MRGSHRITIRLEADLYGSLVEYCQTTGNDLSFAVRQALGSHLRNAGAVQPGGASFTTFLPPEEIFRQAPRYLSWNGDLRKEIRRQFIELLAEANVCVRHYPKTEGLRELYNALLSLSRYLVFGQTVGQS